MSLHIELLLIHSKRITKKNLDHQIQQSHWIDFLKEVYTQPYFAKHGK